MAYGLWVCVIALCHCYGLCLISRVQWRDGGGDVHAPHAPCSQRRLEAPLRAGCMPETRGLGLHGWAHEGCEVGCMQVTSFVTSVVTSSVTSFVTWRRMLQHLTRCLGLQVASTPPALRAHVCLLPYAPMPSCLRARCRTWASVCARGEGCT